DVLSVENRREQRQRRGQLRGEILLGERQLRRRQRRRIDRRDVAGIVQDRAVRVRAALTVGTALPLVHQRVRIPRGRAAALPPSGGQLRYRADVDHLVYGRRERDPAAGHGGDPRAPHSAGDDDRVGLDVSTIRADLADLTE